MKYLSLFLAITFSAVFAKSQTNSQPEQLFQDYIQAHFKSYETNKRVQVTRLGGGWVKEKFTLFGEPNYDAKENPDSKINTFTGWCEFSLLRGYY